MEYVTIPNVELVTAGMEWPASTGPTSVTMEHLADALAAFEDPHVLPPRVKIGHSDSRFDGGVSFDPYSQDGAPALGKVANPRLVNDGAVLMGDLIEVPAWLAEAAPSAYPSRSIECVWNLTTPGDRKYSMVLTAVALLGTAMPAVQDLEDLERLLTEGPDALTGGSSMGKDSGASAASVSVDRIRQAFNWEWATSDPVEGLDTYWWWARDIRFDPNEVIADDDQGGLYAIPFTTDGEDEVTFGEPMKVRQVYVPTAATSASSLVARTRQRVGAAALSRPDKPEPAAASATDSTRAKEGPMPPTPQEIRERLGLPEDATDEQVAEAYEALGQAIRPEAPAAEEPEVPGTAEPELVTLSKGQYEELQRGAQQGSAARTAQLRGEVEAALAAALTEGRIAKSDEPAFRSYAEQYPGGLEKGVAALRERLGALSAGLIPVDQRGAAASTIDGQHEDDETALAIMRERLSRKAVA